MSLAIGRPELISMLSGELDDLPDERKQSNNSKYTVEEAMRSAFSVFFMQSPSFLDHQRLMKSHKGRDNAASLFGIESIPCDNQIRTLLDPVRASTVFGVFRSVYHGLSQTGNLKPYQCFGGEFLLALDGTEYFSSQKIHCGNAFATCHEIDEQNVSEIVTAGRARWKVENEGNNVLKTKGYHLQHNFGHGQNNLAELGVIKSDGKSAIAS